MTQPSSGSLWRRRSWLFGVALTILMSLALVLLFLLIQATQRWDVYEQNYSLLFGLNTVFAVFLLSVIVWFSWRLWLRWRQGKFGSRLLVKLAAIFGLVGILQGCSSMACPISLSPVPWKCGLTAKWKWLWTRV